MRFAVLGSLEVHTGSGRVGLEARKQRSILAILLSRHPRPVPKDTLIASLWNDRPPKSVHKALTWHMLQLRTALGDRNWVAYGSDGYAFGLEPTDVDSWRFEALLADGSRLMASDPARAGRLLSVALDLWRGPAYGDLADIGVVRDEANRLDELRLVATERRCDADLAVHRHHGLIPDLTKLVCEHPYREALRARLMLALYRAGRQDESLRVYRAGRERLVEELGVEPGAELRHLHKRILEADPDLDRDTDDGAPTTGVPPVSTVVPAQLPAGTGAFTGRHHEVAEVLERVRQSPGVAGPGGVGVTAIYGMPGIGKTALAVHVAHSLASAFPDGQLFIDLHGHSGNVAPVSAANALETLLHSLGVAKADIPDDIDARTTMYRTLLAERRLLIVLDNALGEEQVRRLIPGESGCRVLITSRHPLSALDDAHHVALQALGGEDAVDLFRRVAGDERLSNASPAALSHIVDLCGRLPLAMRIAAARFRLRKRWRIDDLVEKLSDQTRTLSELRAGDLSVTATFQLSYRQLNDGQKRLFRLLGTHVGPDVDLPSAAAFIGMPVDTTEPMLDELVDAQLLRESPAGRFNFHDLLRVFARDLADVEDSAQDRHAARTRVFAWYAHSARAAAVTLRPYREALDVGLDSTDISPAAFDHPESAMRWFAVEEPNLRAVVTSGARDPAWPSWLIVDAMRGFCYLRGNRATWRAMARTGKAAASGDDVAEAAMTHSLGLALSLSGEYSAAEHQYRHGIELTRRSGDERRRVEILLCLAGMSLKTGQIREAITIAREASTLTRQHGNRMLSDALHILGGAHMQLGELRQAAVHLTEAVHRERTRGFDNLTTTMGDLADIHIELGELVKTEELAHEALDLAEQNNWPYSQIHTLLSLSSIHAQKRLATQAIEYAQRAIDIGGPSSNSGYQPSGCLTLAIAILPLSPKDAFEHGRKAHEQAAELGFTAVDRDALECLSHASRRLGDPVAARAYAREALSIGQSRGYVLTEGKSLTALAAAHFADGDYPAAIDIGSRALDIHHACGHRLGEARTHRWLAEAHHALGHTRTARTHWRAASDICRDVGVPAPTPSNPSAITDMS